MTTISGWVLHVSIEQNHAIIWIKTTEGYVLKLTDSYESCFYILPESEAAGV